MRGLRDWGRDRSRAGVPFVSSVEAGVSTMFALVLLVLVGAIGFAVDGSHMFAQRSKLQSTADLAALAAAKELRLANATSQTIDQAARRFIQANLITQGVDAPVDIAVTMESDHSAVEVRLTERVATYFLGAIGITSNDIGAFAKARLVGGMPVCLVGLDTNDGQTITLTQNATLSAPGCEIYSNSKNPKGITVMMSGLITAGGVCSVGGKYANKGSILPDPQLDCPTLADPLASRIKPQPSSYCDYLNKMIIGGTATLTPGTYCGGLYVSQGAVVTLSPGIYYINNGPLMVDTGGSLSGTDAGIYLAGNDATLYFDGTSTINLSAPRTGALAGLLLWQDKSVKVNVPSFALPPGVKPPPKLPPVPKLGPGIPKLKDPVNQILSNNARNLLGTIYFPDGSLYVDANQPIADRSAYTIIVAQQFGIASGPNLVLNSDYASTTVPVPKGLGPQDGVSMLVQ